MKKSIFLVLTLCFSLNLIGQTAMLTQKQKLTVIDSITALLTDNYVYPKVAKEMINLIRQKSKQGDYDSVENPEDFAQKLTQDLYSISKDKHLRVRFDPQQEAFMRNPEEDEEEVARWLDGMRMSNYGFEEVKIMDGNIGYLKLNSFSNTKYAGETANAAMNYLANTDAIIFDLRQNGGGSPEMIQLISSYLFDNEEPVHLNSFYWRPNDETTQTWTLPYIPGKRNIDALVYVLTSQRTFSAAEEFTYNLKNLERATIVGEITGGGAHPGGTQPAAEGFIIWMPMGRAINPITNINWEGTGVKPHKEVAAPEALDAAYLDALEKLHEKAEDPMKKKMYGWKKSRLVALANPAQLDEKTMKEYPGKYGPRKILLEDGTLYYQREGNPKYELIPMKKDWFIFEDIPYFKIEILRKEGAVIGLKGHYDNGTSDKTMKERT